MMKIVVNYTELLPQNIFTITHDQVRLIPEVSTDSWSADRNRLNN